MTDPSGYLEGPYDRGRGGPGGRLMLDEPQLHFGEDVVVPDLAGWRRAAANAAVRAEPFDAVELEFGEPWPEAGPA